MGLAKRRLYKPDRRPARAKSILGVQNLAPNSCLDASGMEVARALVAICRQGGLVIGICRGYDSLKDQYEVTVKSLVTGKAGDFQVDGEVVGALIRFTRALAGEKMYRPWEKKALPGMPR